MDRKDALRRLPVTYAIALRLRDNGADDSLIAAGLDLDATEVGPLLNLGEAKLERLLGAGQGEESLNSGWLGQPG
jgi:hypothetical protein